MSSNETPLSQETSTPNSSQNVRGKNDPAWGHCKQIDEGASKVTMLCIYCDKRVRRGGINRFKAHLAGQKGQIEACKKVPADVQHQMKQLLEQIEKNKKRKLQEQSNESDTFEIHEDPVATQKSISCNSQKGKNIPHVDDYFMPRTTPGAQPSLKSVLQNKQIVEKCDKAIAKWMIDASIPFNAVNSAYYQPMIDAISAMSPGYKAPNFYRMRGPLLNMWVDEVKKLVESYKEVWKETGCTLMADGWTDRSRRTLINFLVYCPKGTVFLRSVDASYASKTAEMLFKLFREMVLYVGAENVVHIVTDNAANYVVAGGRDILRPAPTRFATNFIALQSILAQKDALRAMVTSRDWTGSTYAKDSKAKIFVEQILDSGFWKQCADIVKLTEPLVRVLRIVDSEDKPAMGFLYQAIYKAREEMIRRFRRNKRKVEPYLEVVDRRWDSQLRKDLHAAGYWLNPACRFNAEEFEKHRNTQSGVLELIDRYTHGDLELQDKLNEGMRMYKNSEGDFARRAAIRERSTIMPDEWWDCYGCSAPELQKLAIHVLSQTCSASGCERNWSVFEHIHSKKRNRLEHQKLNDLVYVRYNLRLQQRNRLRKQNYDPINLETLDDHSHWVLEESPPFLTREEMEAFRNDLANMSIQSASDDIDKLNLDEDEDDDMPQPPDNTMEDVNPNQSNIGEESHFFHEEELPEVDPTLAPWI